MGYDWDRFPSEVSDDLKCKICDAVVESPLQTPCGQNYCSKCVLQWLFRHHECPAKCTHCKRISFHDLKSVPEFNETVDVLQIRCDFSSRGCQEIITIGQLNGHVNTCPYRPVKCHNKNCGIIVNYCEMGRHEKETCPYRAVGVCNLGCGLELTFRQSSQHNCVEALRAHVSNQEMKINSLSQDKKRMASHFAKQEKCLQSQIGRLQSELQAYALRYQKRLSDYKAQINRLCQKSNSQGSEERLKITLKKDHFSLGFHIRGGYLGEVVENEGILVSRITEHGPAEAVGLQIDDQLLSVNGQDLSHSSHEEAVAAFKNADEPIVVEVLRKMMHDNNPVTPNTTTSVSTQTENWRPHVSPYPSDPALVLSNQSCTPNEIWENVFDEFEFQNLEEYIYEEVQLPRVNCQEKLGLTLSYITDLDGATDVFVREVDSRSLAAADGRIKEGDQIIQINGEEVRSREQAMGLFGANSKQVSLVVARSSADEFCTENLLNERLASLDEKSGDEEVDDHSSSVSGKQDLDSGLCRTDESGRNDTSSEQDLEVDRGGSPISLSAVDYSGAIGPPLSTASSTTSSLDNVRREFEDEVARDIAAVQLQKDAPPVPPKRSSSSSEEQQRGRAVPRMGTRMPHSQSSDSSPSRPSPKGHADDTMSSTASSNTSAYNTGDSNKSTPLNVMFPPPQADTPRSQTPPPPKRPESSKKKKKSAEPKKESDDADGGDLGELYSKFAEVMYTNEANLEHTMAIQQKLFMQQVMSKESPPSKTVSFQNDDGDSSQSTNDDMRYVVKVRSDGTRYIMRKPVRQRILKERERKIHEERGLTTDDDAMSEWKMGRYWSKSDRKRHFDRSREHKRKREQIARAKIELSKTKIEPIVEMSHRKMMKQKGRRLFDDFITTEEILAHGTKFVDGNAKQCPLLSVTTV